MKERRRKAQWPGSVLFPFESGHSFAVLWRRCGSGFTKAEPGKDSEAPWEGGGGRWLWARQTAKPGRLPDEVCLDADNNETYADLPTHLVRYLSTYLQGSQGSWLLLGAHR